MPAPEESEANVAVRLEALSREECFELLGTTSGGRLALLVGGRPEILPVNYVVEGPAVVFRTSAATQTSWHMAMPDPSRDRLDGYGHVISKAEAAARAALPRPVGVLSLRAAA